MGILNRRAALQLSGGVVCSSLFYGISPQAATGIETAAKPRIKIGQIGVGHAHATKLSVYRNSSDYEVVGIVEPDVELRKLAESQDTYRDLKWMTQEQLLNVAGLQAVLVETRVRDLLNVAEVCVASGKHIHLDKPAGESLSQFARILRLAASQKLMVQMGYMFRYNPAIVFLRKLLKDGWLGDVFEVHAVMSKDIDPETRRGLAEYPGGVMFELGGHITDLVIGVLGRPTNITAFPQHAHKIDDQLKDNMLAVFEYPHSCATLKSSAMEIGWLERRHLTVCGTKGTIHIQPLDNPSARLALSEPHGAYKAGYQDISFPKYVRYVDDAADMACVLRGEKENEFSYDHDLTVQTSLIQACGLTSDI